MQNGHFGGRTINVPGTIQTHDDWGWSLMLRFSRCYYHSITTTGSSRSDSRTVVGHAGSGGKMNPFLVQ